MMPIRVQVPGRGVVEFPDGTDEQTMRAALQQPIEDEGLSGVDRAVEALPSAGAFVGSLAGGRTNPLGIALSGLGGAAGKAAQLFVRGARQDPTVPQTVFGQFKEIAGEGVKQAGIEGVGRGVMGLASRGANRLYQAALKPSTRLDDEFPGLVRAGVREGVAVSRRGMSKAKRLVGQGAADVDAELARAAAAGSPAGGGLLNVPARVSGRPVLRQLKKPLEQARDRAEIGLPDQSSDVIARASSIRQNFRGGKPLLRAQTLKRTAQNEADTAFRAREAGQPLGVKPEIDLAVARGLRESIEDVAPGVADLNRREQSLIGVQEALGDALHRAANQQPSLLGPRLLFGATTGAGTSFATGNPLAGLAVGAGTAMIGSPSAMSRAAIGIDRLGLSAPQIARLLEALYQQQQLGQEGH